VNTEGKIAKLECLMSKVLPDTQRRDLKPPSLDEMLSDARMRPLSLSDFREFCESQSAEENVDFLQDVQEYKTASEKEHDDIVLLKSAKIDTNIKRRCTARG